MIFTDRKDIAKALNFGKYPVLTFDLDKKEGSKAVVTKMSNRYGLMRNQCQLHRDYQTKGDGVFYLGTKGTMISSDFSVQDALECAEYANAPVIDSYQEVAILVYSKMENIKEVHLVKAGRCNSDYSSATVFEPFSE